MFNSRLKDENQALIAQLTALRQRVTDLGAQLQMLEAEDLARRNSVNAALKDVKGLVADLGNLIANYAGRGAEVKKGHADAVKEAEEFEAKHFPNSRSKL